MESKQREKASELFKIKDYLKALNIYEDLLHSLNEKQSIIT